MIGKDESVTKIDPLHVVATALRGRSRGQPGTGAAHGLFAESVSTVTVGGCRAVLSFAEKRRGVVRPAGLDLVP